MLVAQTMAEALCATAIELTPFIQLLFYDVDLCIDCCNCHSFYFGSLPCLRLYEIDQSVQVSFSGF